jgi:hypothetical protein
LEEIAETPREALAEKGSAARKLAAEYGPQNCAAIVAETLRGFLKIAMAARLSPHAAHPFEQKPAG